MVNNRNVIPISRFTYTYVLVERHLAMKFEFLLFNLCSSDSIIVTPKSNLTHFNRNFNQHYYCHYKQPITEFYLICNEG